MQKFIIKKDFLKIFPNAKFGVVLAKDLINKYDDKEYYQNLIKEAEYEAKKFIKKDQLSKNEVVKVWRDAFKKFKTKKGARASIEALLKRVQKGKSLSSINPLVDIYNSISLKYGLPCGGEDIDKFEGNVRLTLANGDEDFVRLGSDKNSPPYKDEVVYKDDAGAICRCFNWREAMRTILTEKTKDAFLIIELIDDKREDVLKEAINDLSNQIENRLDANCSFHILDKNNRELNLK
ncbi:MAG: B3/B4 domain-containing protein [Bacillota bacterium]